MANNYEAGTVMPYFPIDLVKKYDEAGEFPSGVDYERDGYLYVEDGCEDWDVFANVLQRMLIEWQSRDEKAPLYAYIEACYYCDKMRPGEFGGFGIFITAHEQRYVSTGGFMNECIGKIEKGEIEA